MSRRGSVLEGVEFKGMDFGPHFEAMRMAQQDKQFNAQLSQQKEKDADAEKYKKLKIIDDATDPTKYQSSSQKANSLATKQLLDLRNKYAGKTNIPVDQLYLELQQELTPIAHGYSSYKGNLVQQEELAKQAVKANPNLDLEKVLSDLQKEVDDEYLSYNPDGTVAFNQAKIGTESDALNRILKPENAWKYSKGISPVVDYVKKEGKKGELFSQAPDGTQINYSTTIPDWAQLVDEKGNPIEADPKTGLIPKGVQPRLALKGTIQDYQETDESGKPMFKPNGEPVMKKMVVVSQATMNKILNNDEMQYAFEGDWQKHKRMSNIQLDPSREQDLKKIYFSQWLADNGLTQPYVSSRTHLPPQQRVSVRVGDGKAADEVRINNLYKRIGGKIEENIGKGFTATRFNSLANDEQAVIKQAVEGAGYDIDEGGSNIFLAKDGDNYKVYKAEDGNLQISPKTEIVTLSFEGTNFKAQPGVKEKREVVEQSKNQSKPVSKPKIVEQGGYKYQLNEKTGQYEPIK